MSLFSRPTQLTSQAIHDMETQVLPTMAQGPATYPAGVRRPLSLSGGQAIPLIEAYESAMLATLTKLNRVQAALPRGCALSAQQERHYKQLICMLGNIKEKVQADLGGVQ